MDWDYHRYRTSRDLIDYGVNWDITNAVKGESTNIVTHQWNVWSSPDLGGTHVTHRIRLAIKFQIPDHPIDPWTLGVSYHCQEAFDPSNHDDPAWVSICSYNTHDAALAYLETQAKQFGWTG